MPQALARCNCVVAEKQRNSGAGSAGNSPAIPCGFFYQQRVEALFSIRRVGLDFQLTGRETSAATKRRGVYAPFLGSAAALWGAAPQISEV